jgi:hypothetical protein
MPANRPSPRNFLIQRAARLRRSTWSLAFGRAWLTFMACAALKLILPAPLRHLLAPILSIAPLLPLMAKDLSHWPDAVARTRSALAARAWGRLPAAWLPPELVGLLRLDSALRRGSLQWLLRRPPTPAPAGRGFGYLERGSYRTVGAIALLSLLIELPLDALVGALFIPDPALRRLMHVLLAMASLSGLAWVLGDRWAIGAGRHVLNDEGLHLRIGVRTTGLLAHDAIVGCERLCGSAAEWRERHGIEREAALLASPFDQPNAVLLLDERIGASRRQLHHLGRERAGLRCVFLYLDDPAALGAALASRADA